MTIKRIIYTSVIFPYVTSSDLNDLLDRAREKNTATGVTGILVYGDGQLIQCIEGPEQVVDDLAAKIRADKRHFAMTIVSEENDVDRLFATWSMGYVTSSGQEISAKLGTDTAKIASAEMVSQILSQSTSLAANFISSFVSALNDQRQKATAMVHGRPDRSASSVCH